MHVQIRPLRDWSRPIFGRPPADFGPVFRPPPLSIPNRDFPELGLRHTKDYLDGFLQATSPTSTTPSRLSRRLCRDARTGEDARAQASLGLGGDPRDHVLVAIRRPVRLARRGSAGASAAHERPSAKRVRRATRRRKPPFRGASRAGHASADTSNCGNPTGNGKATRALAKAIAEQGLGRINAATKEHEITRHPKQC